MWLCAEQGSSASKDSPGEQGSAPAHKGAPVCEGHTCRAASSCAGLRHRHDGGKMLQRSARPVSLHATGAMQVARCPGHGGGEQDRSPDVLGSPGLIS